MVKDPAIVILGVSALPLAQKIKAALGGDTHGPRCVTGPDHGYEKATAALAELFNEGRPIIGLCASGILIRALAPHLADKRDEPPVVAVAEDGSSAVPLLRGHHGANDLARKIAAITGGHAAVTTASDVRLGIALDEPPEGGGVSVAEAAFQRTHGVQRRSRIVGGCQEPILQEEQLAGGVVRLGLDLRVAARRVGLLMVA